MELIDCWNYLVISTNLFQLVYNIKLVQLLNKVVIIDVNICNLIEQSIQEDRETIITIEI